MALLNKLRALVEEPPPAFVFEISAAGIAYSIRETRKQQPGGIQFLPFHQDVLAVSPMADNVLLPDVLQKHILELAPMNGARKRREAALILPDYCTRVTVLDFDTFPAKRIEQLPLIRFRMKKTVPFDLDEAALSYQVVEKRGSKKVDVLVAAAAVEIVAKYEAPLRAAGLQTGFITTSMLAAMDLLPKDGLHLAAKLSGSTLTVTVCEGRNPKLVRCVQLPELNMREVMTVLYPTVAYAEDELPERPKVIYLAGFGEVTQTMRLECEGELGLMVEPMRSLWGNAGESNAGLLGFLQAQEAA
ncbi:MAG: hypothetical protein JJE04_27035 [Acidobacteriia bacterium]|nr:hypothetical protein [Terriglobia bacterium]